MMISAVAVNVNNSVAGICVHELTSSQTVKWDAFVEACPHATFFHRAGWKQVIEEAFGHVTHYLYAESGGEIKGVLPLVHMKSHLFGNALISTPFCVYGGVVSEDVDVCAKLEQEACRLAEELK